MTKKKSMMKGVVGSRHWAWSCLLILCFPCRVPERKQDRLTPKVHKQRPSQNGVKNMGILGVRHTYSSYDNDTSILESPSLTYVAPGI